MENKLFVGGIPWSVTDDQLKAHFEKVGKVVSVNILKDKYTGRSRGYGFVEMGSADEAKAAIAEFDGVEFEGRKLNVDHAKPLQRSNVNEEKRDMGDPRNR